MTRSSAASSLTTTSTSPLAFASLPQLVDAVRVRRSVRTFEPVSLRAEHVAFIRAYLDDPTRMTGLFGGRGRVELLEDVGDGDKEIGTYGYVKGYQAVLAAIAPAEPVALVDLAYALHGLVLQLTRIGLGTVWLGAAFNRADVLESLILDEGELIAALIPVGYPTNKRLMERLMRGAIRSDNRKPMDATYFFAGFDTPLGDAGGPLRSALELARRAPSAKNKQSWRVVVSRDLSRLDIYAAFSLRHQVGIGRKMYACPPEYIDLGTYLASLEIGLVADGIEGTFTRDDPGLALPPGTDLEYIASFLRR
jgi:nitroreductase